MNEAEELLPAGSFVRIHRSYLVARSKVSRIERGSVWIKDKELPIGAGYAHEIDKITGRS
jgi:DNA-binding LytR/AlgR family response regulator